jgi:branched-chain amino acid transport system ATP-binding protein
MVIEHNLDFITKVSDYLYAMDFGKLIAEGTPGDVLSDSAVLTAYSVQARIGATSHDAS